MKDIGFATKFTDGGFAVDAFWFPNIQDSNNEAMSSWFGWGGFGGSIAQFNPRLGLTFVFSGNGILYSHFNLFNQLRELV